MVATVMSSREFTQDMAKATRAASEGPVIVTDRGNPAFVLPSHSAYRQLAGGPGSLVDLLDHPESADIEFQPERLPGGPMRRADIG